MLKPKLQYFGHLMRRTDSLEKTLMLGKIEDGRRRSQQRMRWLDGITSSMGMSLVRNREAWLLQSMGLQSRTQLSNCTTTADLGLQQLSEPLSCSTSWKFKYQGLTAHSAASTGRVDDVPAQEPAFLHSSWVLEESVKNSAEATTKASSLTHFEEKAEELPRCWPHLGWPTPSPRKGSKPASALPLRKVRQWGDKALCGDGGYFHFLQYHLPESQMGLHPSVHVVCRTTASPLDREEVPVEGYVPSLWMNSYT